MEAKMIPNEIAGKVFNLEERTFSFATDVRIFIRSLKINKSNLEDKKQLVRASGSVGANYIEANEALSPRDFAMRIKICKKEAKESHFWLRILASEIGSDSQAPVKR
jgi:four helix bundle protein